MLRQFLLLTTAFSCAALSLFAQSNEHVLIGSYAQIAGGEGAVYAINPDGTGYTTIKEFAGNPDGQNPVGQLLSSGDGYLYGLAQDGGNVSGTLFEIKEDGTGFNVIHTFTDVDVRVLAGLVMGPDDHIYGVAGPRNVNNGGAIFRINRDGSDYTTVYNFGNTRLGNNCKLAVDGDGTIYGIGSASDLKVVFKLNPDGTGFTILHDFDDVAPSRNPNAQILLASNGLIYGTTGYDGLNNVGTVFRIHKDGTSFEKILDFPNTFDESPDVNLVEVNGVLYGSASTIYTCVYKLNLDGSGFSIIASGPQYGGGAGALSVTTDGKLIVVSRGGGGDGNGTISRINTDGTNGTVLTQFDHPDLRPYAATVLSNGDLIGPRGYGYESQNGCIYHLPLAGELTIVQEFPQPEGAQPMGNILSGADGMLYGITQHGGSKGTGVIYRMKKDGTDYEVLRDIERLWLADAIFTNFGGPMLASDGFLYGTTTHQPNSVGNLYKISMDGQAFEVIFQFDQLTGEYPTGHLLEASDGKLYGMCVNGGTFGNGTVYKINKDGTGAQNLHSFESQPAIGSLIEGTGGYLLGIIPNGGEHSRGFVFRIKTDGTGYEKVKDFGPGLGTANYGGSLVAHPDGRLYGMTRPYGDDGIIFSIASDGTDFQTFHTLTAANPVNSLALSADGYFYGTTDYAESFFGIKDVISGAQFHPLLPSSIRYFTSQLQSNLLVVEIEDQAITFTLASDATVLDAPITLTGTSDSGLPIIYASDNHDVATIVGNTLTIVGAGVAHITATQPGDRYTRSAPPVTLGFTVSKIPQTITFESLPAVTFDDPSFDLTATSTSELIVSFSSSDETVATINGGHLTIVGAGTTTITASQAGTGIYSAAPDVSHDFIVEIADQTITFEGIADKVIGSGAFTLDATASSDLVVTYTTTSDKVTIAGNSVTLVKSGRLTIKADQAGNNNYHPAPPVEKSFCINPLKPTITLSVEPDAVILTSSNETGNQWYNNGTPIEGATNETLLVTAADAFTVVTTIDDCASATSEIIAVKTPQKITFESLANATFGDPSFALTGTSNSELTLLYTSSNESVATVTGAQVTIVGTGTTTITASQAGSDLYEAAADVSQELTVELADQTITFEDIPAKVMGSAAFTLTATASSELAVTYSTTSDKATIAGNSVTLVKSGRLTIKADQAGSENYNPAPSIEKSFCINPPTPTITLNVVTDGVTLTSSSETGNQWYRNGTLIEGATLATLPVTEPDAFTVITTIDDCVSETSATLDVIVTGIESQSHGDGVTLYNNPVSRFLTVVVASDDEEVLSMELIDVLGRPVGTWPGRTNREEQFDVAHLTKGMYLLRVRGSSLQVTKRVYKK